MPFRHIITAIFLLTFSALASSASVAEPALWMIKGAHDTVYFFGRVHILRKDAPPRNYSWVPQIQKLLAGTGTTFVAVGAGHLIGPDGVLALMEKAGVSVARQ